MTIENKYNLRSIVYLKTDKDQAARIITGINVRASGNLTYNIAFGATDTWHYECELSDVRDVILATSN